MDAREDCVQVDVITDYLRTQYEETGIESLSSSVTSLVNRETDFFAKFGHARYDDITIQLAIIE
jgi:hypothetical protein